MSKDSPQRHDHHNPSTGGNTLKPQSVDTDELTAGDDSSFTPIDRPLISNSATTTTVSTQSELETALRNVPMLLRHDYSIQFENGSYGDVFVPAFRTTRFRYGASTLPQLELVGDETTPSNVTVSSIGIGAADLVSVRGFEIESDVPQDDENTSVDVRDSKEVALNEIHMVSDPDGTDPDAGITAYNSHVNVNNIDLGASVRRQGYVVKHGGSVVEEPAGSTPSTGNVTGVVYVNGGGWIQFAGSSSTATGDNRLAGGTGWSAYDYEKDAIVTTNDTLFLGTSGARPSPDTTYAFYVDNGGGGNTVAWWFTSDGGSTWTTL